VNDRLAVLRDALAALEQAAHRLHSTHVGLAELFPLNPDGFQVLSDPRRERLDAYAIRYARCQDLLFPAMRALGRAQLEPKAERSFLDLFALMQKQGVVGSVDDWERQRGLRNAVSHEYPNPAEITDILNAIREAVPEILGYVAALRRRVAELDSSR
jgi:hypothetical protein